MIWRRIEDISEEDLQGLVDNAVLEKKVLEYKRELPGNSNGDRVKFLKEVSSFANSEGGHIILGISEDANHVPINLNGIDIQDLDLEKGKLDQIIRDGIKPRLPICNIEGISLSNSNYAVVIEIPKSWIAPHRVTLYGHDKFYARSSNGKYPMDVGELRNAFILSESIKEKIRLFIIDRVSDIYSSEIQFNMGDDLKIIIHLMPFDAFSNQFAISLTDTDYLLNKLRPMGTLSCSYLYNLDGFITYHPTGDTQSSSYVQLFRNGSIEAVMNYGTTQRNQLVISTDYIEDILLKSLRDYIQFMESMNISFPIIVFLTLANVKGYSRSQGQFDFPETPPTIHKDIINFPEIIIDDPDIELPSVLRPVFDILSNSVGLLSSRSYDENGEWIR